MIYLIVYLLDFYPSFLGLLLTTTIFGIIIYVLKYIIMFISEEGYTIYLKDNNRSSYYVDYKWHLLAKNVPLKVTHLILMVVLLTLLPSKKGLYILTGMYVGEKTLDKVQESPLYDKAYKLAEAKLNELLDGANLTLEDKKNESKK